MTENELSKKIIGDHRSLGSGLLESAYQECLFFELKSLGLEVKKEIGNYPLGLLINFHTTLLKNGIKRFINSPL